MTGPRVRVVTTRSSVARQWLTKRYVARMAANFAKLLEPAQASHNAQRTDDQHPEVILAIANLAMTYAIAICRHADLRTKTQMFRLIASALALSCALTTPSRAEVVTLICTVSIVTFVFDIDFTK